MTFKKDLVHGFRWISASQFTRQAVQFATTLVLARLLQPSDFGLMGMAMALFGVMNVSKDLGASAAIIHAAHTEKRFLSSLFWMNVAFGTVAAVLLFSGAGFLAGVFADGRLVDIFRAFTVPFFLGLMSSVQQAILEKQRSFKTVSTIEITSVAAGSMVGIGTAALGFGVWSLVLQFTATSLASFLMYWLRPGRWLPSFRFAWEDIRAVIGYTSNLTGFSLINYFLRNADSIVIGRVLGATELGYYNLAYKVIITPLQNMSAVVSRVLFPLFSSVQDDDALIRSAYRTVTDTIAVLAVPFYFAVAVSAPDLVRVVFGEQWAPAATVLILLTPVGLLQSIDTTTGTLYLSKGRTDLMFLWGGVTSAAAVVSFIIGVSGGVAGVATAYSIATVLWTYPGFLIPLRIIGESTNEFLRQFVPHLLFVAAVSVVVWAVVRTGLEGAGPIVRLLTVAVSFFAANAWYVLRYKKDRLRQFRTIITGAA